jgi:hypothetical protein
LAICLNVEDEQSPEDNDSAQSSKAGAAYQLAISLVTINRSLFGLDIAAYSTRAWSFPERLGGKHDSARLSIRRGRERPAAARRREMLS